MTVQWMQGSIRFVKPGREDPIIFWNKTQMEKLYIFHECVSIIRHHIQLTESFVISELQLLRNCIVNEISLIM